MEELNEKSIIKENRVTLATTKKLLSILKSYIPAGMNVGSLVGTDELGKAINENSIIR